MDCAREHGLYSLFFPSKLSGLVAKWPEGQGGSLATPAFRKKSGKTVMVGEINLVKLDMFRGIG